MRAGSMMMLVLLLHTLSRGFGRTRNYFFLFSVWRYLGSGINWVEHGVGAISFGCFPQLFFGFRVATPGV